MQLKRRQSHLKGLKQHRSCKSCSTCRSCALPLLVGLAHRHARHFGSRGGVSNHGRAGVSASLTRRRGFSRSKTSLSARAGPTAWLISSTLEEIARSRGTVPADFLVACQRALELYESVAARARD